MTITAQRIKEFSNDMAAAMQAVYDKHGLVARPGSFIPSGDGFHFRLNVGLKDTLTVNDGFVANPVLYRGTVKHGEAFGVTVEKLGKRFLSKGIEMVFLGVNQTGHFAVGMKTSNNKEAKVRADELKTATWLN